MKIVLNASEEFRDLPEVPRIHFAYGPLYQPLTMTHCCFPSHFY